MNLADRIERRRRKRWLARHRWDALATYQAEQARGLVHTADEDEWMTKEQKRFDARGGTA